MNLTGNTILITGGTSGIGRALAEQLYERGNTVIIAGRRQELLDEITQANPGMHGAQVDLADTDAIPDFATRIREQFPALNVLVNNAGISKPENLNAETIDLSVAHAIIDTNIVSVLHLTAALLPLLKAQAKSTIITTTSGLAFVPLASHPTYCASKAFLHSWLQSLRSQLRKTSVEILELAPPYVQTELGGASQATDPNAMPLAEYIAEVMQNLGADNPPRGEILVERVHALRNAESTNTYDQVFAAMNQR